MEWIYFLNFVSRGKFGSSVVPVTVAGNVSGLTARIAGPVVIRAVASHVARLVASVADATASAAASTAASVPAVRAVPGDVTRLVAIVAGRLVGGLLAVLGDVPHPVAPVTTVLVLLAFPGEVAVPVTLVAFLPPPVAASAVRPAAVAAAGTLAGEVARLVASVTRRVHLTCLLRNPKFSLPSSQCDRLLVTSSSLCC